MDGQTDPHKRGMKNPQEQVHKFSLQMQKNKPVNNEWNATFMEMQVFINRSVKTSNFTIYVLFK
jgi:hypothetical protein